MAGIPDSIFDNIPEELRSLRQFCVRYGKQPFIRDPTTRRLTGSWQGVKGSWTAPEGYLTFEEACIHCSKLLEKNSEEYKRAVELS